MWLPDVTAGLHRDGAELLIAINASPFETGKPLTREHVAAVRVRETGLPLVYVNQVGGQDELVFDGSSFVLGPQGEICIRLHAFREDFEMLRLQRDGAAWLPMAGAIQSPLNDTEAIYRAMTLGLRDFVGKNGFAGVLIGLSGGVDSALAASLAVDAVGADKVRALMLPSPYTSTDSVEDADECARRLGIRLDTISIAPGMQAFEAMLNTAFEGGISDEAMQDNQPRLRGGLMMAFSRKHNLLLLNTLATSPKWRSATPRAVR